MLHKTRALSPVLMNPQAPKKIVLNVTKVHIYTDVVPTPAGVATDIKELPNGDVYYTVKLDRGGDNSDPYKKKDGSEWLHHPFEVDTSSKDQI